MGTYTDAFCRPSISGRPDLAKVLPPPPPPAPPNANLSHEWCYFYNSRYFTLFSDRGAKKKKKKKSPYTALYYTISFAVYVNILCDVCICVSCTCDINVYDCYPTRHQRQQQKPQET